MLHKVSIAGLTMDPASNTPIIILKSEESDQAIPIWIGLLEATSIASALQDIKYERPMTHDLFKNFSDSLEISIAKIEVCDLKESVSRREGATVMDVGLWVGCCRRRRCRLLAEEG